MSEQQIRVDTLRGELREEKEVVAALEESKRDAERILSKKILELSERTTERDQLRKQVEKLEHDLAECYRLSGSDPDGDSDSMLAGHAVQAVRELREEADKAGEWEEQVGKLLDRIEDVKSGGLPPGHPQSARSKLFNAADQVRKELEG